MEVLKDFSLWQWVLISIRGIPLIIILSVHLLCKKLQSVFLSCLPFDIWRRYIECISNLFFTRILFLIMGFLRFDCQNYGFFSRNSQKLILKSGFIGIGNHKNFIDFLYYSYLFNPLFIRLIIRLEDDPSKQDQDKKIQQVTYAPLDYFEAFKCALSHRGFDPIIVRDQKQWKKIKYRKMQMKKLVSQSFQELKGPIFILLPGINHNQHIAIEPQIAHEIYDNEQKYLRSGVGLNITFGDKPIFKETYKSQVSLLLNILSELSINKLNITALSFRNFKHRYQRNTYSSFIDEQLYSNDKQTNSLKISYQQYLHQLDKQDIKQQQQNSQQKNNGSSEEKHKKQI